MRKAYSTLPESDLHVVQIKLSYEDFFFLDTLIHQPKGQATAFLSRILEQTLHELRTDPELKPYSRDNERRLLAFLDRHKLALASRHRGTPLPRSGGPPVGEHDERAASCARSYDAGGTTKSSGEGEESSGSVGQVKRKNKKAKAAS